MSRLARSLCAVVALLFLVALADFLAPAIANAAPSHTLTDNSRSFWSLLALVPWAIVAGWAVAVVIPYLSALATKHPGHLTGVVTAALSLLDGFLSTLAQQGEHLDLRAALAASFGAWVIASKWHTKVLAGTPAEAKLHSIGV